VTVPWKRKGKEQFSTLGVPIVEIEPWGRGVCGRRRKLFCTNKRPAEPAGGVRPYGIMLMSGTPLKVVGVLYATYAVYQTPRNRAKRRFLPSL
jgi:hypothetical protein